MNPGKLFLLIAFVAFVAVVGFVSADRVAAGKADEGAQAGCGGCGQPGVLAAVDTTETGCGQANCGQSQQACKAKHAEQAERLAAAVKELDAAVKAVQAGEKKAALARLAKVRELVTAARKALTPAPAIANARCPIMGSPIHPERVTPELTRQFKGQTVAFCCGGCPAKWDKLPAAEKAAKLAAVVAPAGK